MHDAEILVEASRFLLSLLCLWTTNMINDGVDVVVFRFGSKSDQITTPRALHTIHTPCVTEMDRFGLTKFSCETHRR